MCRWRGRTCTRRSTTWYAVAACWRWRRSCGRTSRLLLLPALSDERAFDGLAEATRAALSREMPKASLQACHPSRPGAVERTPLPLFQLFCDNPELLVQGGSLGDAAAFLG